MTQTARIPVLRTTGDRITAEQLYAVLRLRAQVFVVEQESAYQDLDGRDLRADTHHLWTGDVDAYLRVLVEPSGGYRIGRVVTAQHARGTGLGARLMEAALEVVGDAPCVLGAQIQAGGFYAKFGFTPSGPEYLEDGIPHVEMRRG
ncbi:GNAT family N-acetyltransferase [Amycolatopsis suaedae]|uniref:GNAT family N-acetyltransferase n=1 Tax=Amycolatopsis suaedae TaxID=2510978 RepID=A0A4Q7JCR7_9PSEU|nr:GNAT family N-acetyltransferase [Amycolatopsis suaedae]RZQ64842.1 GNAT family N-acetyltransferase [Amycolatopsis suaedae]